MRFKRLLALLLAAALALSLLVGCGSGQQSAARVLLNLLDGKYPNISVELDPDLEADLRQAISQAEAENAGDDDAVIRAALETLLGSNITFRNLGDGQQGDTTFDLVFYAGTDPDKAAQAAYSQWNIVFANVPDDGKYGTGLAMVETENGIWMLVKATVEKAGTEDKPEPATVTDISVTPPIKTQYNPGDPFNPAGMVVTVHYSDGSTKKIENITSSGNQGVTWSPANIDADTNVIITYGGKTDTVAVELITLDRIEVSGNYQKEYTVGDSFDPTGMEVTAVYSNGDKEPITDNYTIKIGNDTITSGYTFNTADTYTLTVEYNGITSNSITITVVDKGYTVSEDGKTYSVSNTHGLQAWNEAVQKDLTLNCTLTDDIDLKGIDWTPRGTNFNNSYTGTFDGGGHTITGLTVTGSDEYAGLFGYIGENGTVKNVVLEGVKITSDNRSGNAGGVAGWSYGNIENCSVSGSVSGRGQDSIVGGIVGYQLMGSITRCSSSATVKGTSSVGGVAGATNSGASLTGCYSTENVTLESNNPNSTYAGGVVGSNGASSTLTACYATGRVTGSGSGSGTIYVGGVTGSNNLGTLTACYWSGLPDNDNGGATKVDGTIVTWQTAYDAMDYAARGYYSAPEGINPPKLIWENNP